MANELEMTGRRSAEELVKLYEKHFVSSVTETDKVSPHNCQEATLFNQTINGYLSNHTYYSES